MSQHICQHECPMFNGEMAKEIIEKLAELGTEVNALKRTLLGNGQPGKCQLHDNAISEMRSIIAEDKGRRGVLTVAVAMIVSAVTAISVAFFSWMLRGH